MLVKHWMNKNVVTVGPDESMQDAIYLMREHKVRMLPVLKDGKLTGVLSETDLKRASASDATGLDVHEMLYLVSKIKNIPLVYDSHEYFTEVPELVGRKFQQNIWLSVEKIRFARPAKIFPGGHQTGTIRLYTRYQRL